MSGPGLVPEPYSFIEFAPGAAAILTFKVYHPNNFATFDFRIEYGVSTRVNEARASIRTGVLSVKTSDQAPPVHEAVSKLIM